MMAGARIRIEIDDAQARAALGFPSHPGIGPARALRRSSGPRGR